MNISRRSLVTSVLGIISFGLISSMVSAEERRRARPSGGDAKDAGPLANPLVDPKDAAAAAMNYTEKHSDIKKADLKVDRQGVKFEAQNCANCGFYKEAGNKNGGAVGTCTIFANKLVKSAAWCSSWNKKA